VLKNLFDFIRNFSLKSTFTAERPWYLDADVLARYRFASFYCRGKEILDIGTGLGLGAHYLAGKGAKKVLGLDYSLSTIKLISSKNKSKNVSFLHLDSRRLNKIKNKFDVVVAFEILEHLPLNDVQEFIESISKILKKSGILLLSTPNGLQTKYILGKPYNPYHIKEYKGTEIYKFLKPYFSNISIKGMIYKDRKYDIIQNRVENGPLNRISYLLGHFKLVRELVPYIPNTLRKKVTGETILPKQEQTKFKLTDKLTDAPGLFIYARKKYHI
jgi:2-polyprenyl-3-methyl-5-hydroxy-6-metoxy-1,4-benzoquinol methylase